MGRRGCDVVQNLKKRNKKSNGRKEKEVPTLSEQNRTEQNKNMHSGKSAHSKCGVCETHGKCMSYSVFFGPVGGGQ